MHYVRHTNGDAHFQENVRLAGDWAEDGKIRLKVKARDPITHKMTAEREIYPVQRMQLLVMGGGMVSIRYRQFQGEMIKVALSNVIEVAWRPDIRRYADNG